MRRPVRGDVVEFMGQKFGGEFSPPNFCPGCFYLFILRTQWYYIYYHSAKMIGIDYLFIGNWYLFYGRARFAERGRVECFCLFSVCAPFRQKHPGEKLAGKQWFCLLRFVRHRARGENTPQRNGKRRDIDIDKSILPISSLQFVRYRAKH